MPARRKISPGWPPRRLCPASFLVGVANPDGTIDRRTWELGLAVAVRDGLRSGDVYLPESRRHVSFCTWSMTRRAGRRSAIWPIPNSTSPKEPDDFVTRLQRAFDAVAERAERGLSGNDFVTIRNNRLHLKRRDALELPPRLKQLRRTIEGALSLVRIEDLLMQVDAWCGFTRAFHRPDERAPRIPKFFTTLLATLIAHGTNLGLATMGQSAEGTVDMLQHMTHWCLREETLKAANTTLVNFHHRLPISACGARQRVVADGQRSASSPARCSPRLSAVLWLLRSRGDGVHAYRRPAQCLSHPSDCLRGAGSNSTCSTGCSTTIRSCAPRNILSTSMASRTNSLDSVTCWVLP